MKPAIIVHLKAKSTRLKKKNFKKLLNKPLYKITFDKIKKLKNSFDIFIDSSSEIFEKEAKKYKFNFIKRPKLLNKPNAQGNELIKNCLKEVQNEIIFILHVTNPFIKIDTIKKCVKLLKKNKIYNSVTPVTSLHDRFWYKNKEVNHKYNKLIGSQYLTPINIESGSYCFRRSTFLQEKSRISKKNYFIFLDKIQSVDIDDELDFIFAETLMKKFNL
jgi:CMP-N-acetylneuraminic acid synthetase